MRNSKLFYFILILLLSYSCLERDNVDANLDIEKAKSWFKTNEINLSNLIVKPSARSTSVFKKSPDWSKSEVHTSKTGLKSVEVFLDYDTYLLSSETELKSSRANSINTMLLFEVKQGDYKVYLLKIYPDNPNTFLSKDDFKKFNYDKIPSNFSGKMMIFDWDENFIGGWRIENGKRSKFIGRVTKGNGASSNGRVSRTSTISCYQITTYWYSQACVPGGGCAPPVLIDVTTTVECEYSLAPGDNSGSQGPGDPSANTCFVQHSFVQGLMLPCSDQAPCENGYVRDWNGNCVCPSSMEIINGNCTFRCVTGNRRNDAGDCVPVQNCNTSDQILNTIQNQLDALWKSSNASHTTIPMTNRMENGGWIVTGANGYSFVPFPNTWIRTSCGIDPPANWENDIPQGLVGWIHTHPFYMGEDVSSVCDNKDNPIYKGSPSRDDGWMLVKLLEKTSQFGMKGYIIDGNGIRIYGLNFAAGQFETKVRCGY